LEPSLESPTVATNLISFLKALLDCHMRRGIRFPQWWMLLVCWSRPGHPQQPGFADGHGEGRQTPSQDAKRVPRHPHHQVAFCLLLGPSWTLMALRACCGTGSLPSSVMPNPSTPWSALARHSGAQSPRIFLAQSLSLFRWVSMPTLS